MIGNSEASEQAAALPADSIVVERDDGLFQIGLCDDADGQFPDRRSGCSPEGGSPSALVGAAMSGTVIVAQLIGQDRAQADDIVVRSRSPVFALCRALLAAGANPNSKLECFRGSVLALTVKTVGIGAKLTIKENDWVGPKVVPYEPFSRDRVGRYVRQNDDPAPSPS